MSCNCCWFIQPDTAISSNRNGSKDFVMRKVTLSPAVDGPVRDPLQIYADRFFGHYGIPLLADNASRGNSVAAVRSHFGDNMKSIVSKP